MSTIQDMVALSNNSPLTKQASLIIDKMIECASKEDANTVKAWLKHAVRETNNKINTKPRYGR